MQGELLPETKVSIHAPLGGATGCRLACGRGGRCFNPRAPRGRDGEFHCITSFSKCFNPRAPRGRDEIARRTAGRPKGFNPRAPRGRDFSVAALLAPLTGFNPRAPRGRDPRRMCRWRAAIRFNPRAPRGRDENVRLELVRADAVSIHAPLGGATHASGGDNRPRAGFNPRAPRGRDGCLAALVSGRSGFQSTRP